MEKYTLRQWRQLRGLSQEELAVKAGVTSRTIINYENDIHKLANASYRTVQQLADVLEVKLSQIFLDTTSEKPKRKNK